MLEGVDNYDNYKYLVGQARAYSTMLQEISNLLNEKEQNDNEGTIIDLAKRDPKTRNALEEKYKAENESAKKARPRQYKRSSRSIT